MDKYNKWLNSESICGVERKILEKMSESEIQESFYQNLEFGTAGMRGIMGLGPNRMNTYTIRKASYGFAKYLVNLKKENNCVAIGYDNRNNSYAFALESAKVLGTFGIKCMLFKLLAPTPELSFAVRYFNCIGGIMITASHNPKEYNGYKVYDCEGCQLLPSEVDLIVEHLNDVESELDINVIEESVLRDTSLLVDIDEEFDELYIDQVLKTSKNDVNTSNSTFLYSAQHGTGYRLVMKVMQKANYNFDALEEQCFANGDFINTISPNPEEKSAYNLLIQKGLEKKYDLLVTTDPDADRLGIAVYHNNEYVLLNGNQTAALMVKYLCETAVDLNNTYIVDTVVSSALGRRIAASYGVLSFSTLTGFKYIGEMIKNNLNKLNYLIGYEESYGSLVSPFVRDKDAVQATLILSEMVCYYKENNLTLIDVLELEYKTFGTYYETQVAFTLDGVDGVKKVEKIMNYFRNNSDSLNWNYLAKEDYLCGESSSDSVIKKLHLPKADVLKFVFENDDFIALRPSGTEPKLKFYFVLSDVSHEIVKAKAETFISQIKKIVSEIK